MNIIILTPEDKIDENLYKLSDERFRHVKEILKSDVGDVLQIGILNGAKGFAKIIRLLEKEVILEIDKLNSAEILGPIIDIICALPRPQTLKKVLNTCATMGVGNLFLIRSEKVEKSYFHSPLLDKENYTKYLIEGLSQGKRTILPKVSIHKRFKQFFEKDFEAESMSSVYLLADPNCKNYLSKSDISDNKKVFIAIGPEAGWNDFEVNFMLEKGFNKFKLSNNILRVENAVTASISQIELLLNQ